MKISEHLEKYTKAKHEADEAYQKYAEKRDKADALKAALWEQMQKIGVDSVKSTVGTASVRRTQGFQITDMDLVRNWLMDNGIDETPYIKFNKTGIDSLLATALKKNGELVPGTQLVTTEALSIREAK